VWRLLKLERLPPMKPATEARRLAGRIILARSRLLLASEGLDRRSPRLS